MSLDEKYDEYCYCKLFEKALQEIAEQKKTYDPFYVDGDVEFAYNTMITIARSALKQSSDNSYFS